MQIRPFNVLPKLPHALEPLREIAYNVWFAWNWEAVQLFIRMDASAWEESYQNPALMLGVLTQEKLQAIADDDSFVANMNRVYEKFKAYMESSTWFSRTYPEAQKRIIAYFSTEYGIDVGLPMYSGGLGVLAGDHLKAASDLGMPMVAVGLLYREGYLKQYLNADGWQNEAYPVNDWYNMPVTLATDEKGLPIRAQIEIGNETVFFQIWKVQVGRIPLYLLDTDLPENKPEHRGITKRLYDGDRSMRLRQEILLGVGGVRALAALGIEPSVCHMNEGHSAFMAVERIRQIMETHKLSRQEAWEVVWATTVFTTHTPVPAGNERFDPALVRGLMERYIHQLNMNWDEFLALSRENPGNPKEEFCLTIIALRHAAYSNGVSRLHGKVSQSMWQPLWPNLPIKEVPISSITNGIHTRSWLSHDMAELLDRYLGPRFAEEPMDFNVWSRITSIPDGELWRTHEKRRERLVWFARKRLRQQLMRRGASPHIVAEAEQILDPEALTIGFARRFAEYKRGTLLLRDPDRLLSLLCKAERPVQIIFAGKAHPLDSVGKQLIKEIIHFIRGEGFRDKIVFLEDYDINVARYLVQGADVWLNTPRRPLEASGTSGMKAAANGALHLSTLDGWWVEGYSSDVGWTIGGGEVYDNPAEQDIVESGALYEILEREVVPMFYDRGPDGLPRRWIARMKLAMMKIGSKYNSHRMASEYVQKYYLNASQNFLNLAGDGQARAKDLAAWRQRSGQHWNEIRFESIESNIDRTLAVGDNLEVTVRVNLGNLRPEDVQVQLYHGLLAEQGQIIDGLGESVQLVESKGSSYTYHGVVPCERSGRRAFAVRVLPSHPSLVHPYVPGLIRWA